MKKLFPILLALGLAFLSSCASAPAPTQAAEVSQAEAAAPAETAAGPEPAAAPLSVPAQVDPWALAPDSAKELFARTDALVAAGSWKSAWDLLLAADPGHKDPWLLARSIELVLDGHVDTDLHLGFTLRDLAEGTTPASEREGAEGKGELDFAPGLMADEQAQAGIASVPALDRALGRYYSQVIKLYPGAWIMADSDIAQLVVDSLGKARVAGAYDIGSLLVEAESLMNMGGAADAEILLVAAEGLDPTSVPARYDHALALLMQDRPGEALPILDALLGFDQDPASRLSALNLAAEAASQVGKGDLAESYLAKAEEESPDRPDPGLERHYIAVMKGDPVAAMAAGNILLDRFGAHPQIISALVKTWFQAGDNATAFLFLDSGLQRFDASDEGAGAFAFYKSVLLLETAESPDDLAAVGPALDLAETRFKAAYPADASVFGIIGQIREAVASRAAQFEEALAAEEAGSPDEAPAEASD